jgi:uncharacterized protein (DUF1778 family)
MTDTADQVIRARIDRETKVLLERAARAEGLTLSAWMRLYLIRIAEEVLARRRRVAARKVPAAWHGTKTKQHEE